MTIQEFSQSLGISTATISRAFSDKGRISPKTRTFIRQKAAELGYRPNLHARNMARRTTDGLAMFYEAPPTVSSDYYVAELSFGITSAASQHGRSMQMHAINTDSDASIKSAMDLILNGAIGGFILNLITDWGQNLVDAAERVGLPYLIIDNTREPSEKVLSMGPHIEAVSERAGDFLRRLGKKRPAFVRGIHDHGKIKGFARGFSIKEEALTHLEAGTSFAEAHACWTAFAKGRVREELPDCLYCANDVLAIGTIRAIKDQGLSVPGDISVIGCDDLAMSAYCDPSLTTLRLPKFELGEIAVQRLIALVDGKPLPATSLPECNLIIRNSA